MWLASRGQGTPGSDLSTEGKRLGGGLCGVSSEAARFVHKILSRTEPLQEGIHPQEAWRLLPKRHRGWLPSYCSPPPAPAPQAPGQPRDSGSKSVF